jgi:hypothetical protein
MGAEAPGRHLDELAISTNQLNDEAADRHLHAITGLRQHRLDRGMQRPSRITRCSTRPTGKPRVRQPPDATSTALATSQTRSVPTAFRLPVLRAHALTGKARGWECEEPLARAEGRGA